MELALIGSQVERLFNIFNKRHNNTQQQQKLSYHFVQTHEQCIKKSFYAHTDQNSSYQIDLETFYKNHRKQNTKNPKYTYCLLGRSFRARSPLQHYIWSMFGRARV